MLAMDTRDHEWASKALKFLIWRCTMNAVHALEAAARRLREAAK
jgi:hypothetical protein